MPFYEEAAKNMPETEHYKEEHYKEKQKEGFFKRSNKPIIYSDGECKSAEDYGEYVKIIGKMPDYALTSVLYIEPQENYSCYIPPTPFLGKYSSLYYEPDEITDDFLAKSIFKMF
jgi:hypothetical protein